MHRRLQAAFAEHPLVAEIRGFGLIGAIEFVKRKDPPTAFDSKLTVGARVSKRALSGGVVTRALPNADSIAFSPPLIISESEIDEVVKTVREAVDDVYNELVSEGLI